MSTAAELELMAHLMRRAGFGATRGELEARLAKGYEATVEELLQPGDDSELEKDLVEEVKLARSQRCHQAIQVLRRRLDELAPDAGIVFGDDPP